MSTNVISQTKMYAFISHSPQTYPSNEPNIDNMPLARRKRRRTLVSELGILQGYFNMCKTPTRNMRLEIAQKVNMDEKSVQIWFQNRRQSMRRGERGIKQVTVIPEVNQLLVVEEKPKFEIQTDIKINKPVRTELPKLDVTSTPSRMAAPFVAPLSATQSYTTTPTLPAISRPRLVGDGLYFPDRNNFNFARTGSLESISTPNVVKSATLPMLHMNKSTSSLPNIASPVSSPEVSLPSINAASTTKLPSITLPSITTAYTPYKSANLPPTPLTSSQFNFKSTFKSQDSLPKLNDILPPTPLNNKTYFPTTPFNPITSTPIKYNNIEASSPSDYDDTCDESYIQQKESKKTTTKQNITLVETNKKQPTYLQNNNNQSLTFKITKRKLDQENGFNSKKFRINDLLNSGRKPLGEISINTDKKNCIDSLISLKSGTWNE